MQDPDGSVGAPQTGWLIYLKSSLLSPLHETKKSHQPLPANVRSYAEMSEFFPHQTTADQFFSDDQFEAYRMLGRHIAETMLGDVAEKNPTSAPTADDLMAWCDQTWNAPTHATPTTASTSSHVMIKQK